MNEERNIEFADPALVRQEIDSSLAKIETELENLQKLLVKLEVEEINELTGLPAGRVDSFIKGL